jgi:peptidoglycan/LPS O-acetylase OafA/YrhL
MTQRERNPQIQALRALAAGLVLIYHAKWIDGGYIGVDIFYVISGFLITGILLRELDSKSTISLVAFYARRTKRLLPASFVVIFATAIAALILLPASMRQSLGKDVIAASTYISNFLFALWENDYQNLNSTPSPFIHFWSLAVEEQFYIFWPLFILILFRIGKDRAVFYGVLTTLVASFLFSLYLTERAPIWAFYILPTRAWELAAGALLVFLPELKKFRPVVALFSFVAICIATLIFDKTTPFPGIAALAPVVATVLLLASRSKWPPLINVIAKSRVTQWLGAISYPLYLWHWPVLVIPAIYLGEELTLIQTLLLLALTVLLAGLTHRYVEAPMREVTLSHRKIFTCAAVATVFSIVLGLTMYSQYSNQIRIESQSQDQSFESVVEFSLDDVRSKPKINEDGCHIHIRQTVSPRCEYGDLSSDQTIVLYGDSHAAQWFPALDLIGKKRGIKIVSLTKSACPSAEVIKELSSQYNVKDCQAFRDSSVARINTIKPLAVILTGMQPFTAPYSDESARSWWLAGESTVFNRIKSATKFPIYLTDTPLPQIDIPDCLVAGRGAKCDTSRPVAAEVAPGLIPINPTPWLCTDKCPAVVDGIVAYRDKSHLTVDMSKHLSVQLENALLRLGLF